MSFFQKLSNFGKSPASQPAATPPASPSPQSSVTTEPPASPPDSSSSRPAVDVKQQSPFVFWSSDLTLQEVEDAKNKNLDLDAKDPYGESALIRAVRHGDAAVAAALLAAGAHVNATDSSGETALSWAAQMGKTEVLKLLVDHPSVEMDKADKGGNTALYDACCCQFR